MCEKGIGLADLDEGHVLYDPKKDRYWLHDFHNIFYDHECQEGNPLRDDDPATNNIFKMFPCFFLQEELRTLRLWE